MIIKVLLGISLLANAVLGVAFFTRKPEKEIIEKERLIIETHSQTEAPVEIKKEPKKKKSSHDSTPEPLGFEGVGEEVYRELNEKAEADKTEFFTRELGSSEEKVREHNRLREEFYRQQSKLWDDFKTSHPSFEQRRDMIKLEEELYKKLEKLHGKEKWKKFQKFRDKYNNKGFKQQTEDGQPFIFMNL